MSTPPVIYSRIDSSDGDSLIELGRKMHLESSYSKLGFSPDRVLETFRWYLEDPMKACFLAKQGDDPVGMYAGYMVQYYFSDEWVASDLAWFVVKEKRGTRVGLKLLDLFERWALDNHASEVRLGISTDIKPDAFDSLMKKRKYSRVGANYRLENVDV
jgi:hypothetical protein